MFLYYKLTSFFIRAIGASKINIWKFLGIDPCDIRILFNDNNKYFLTNVTRYEVQMTQIVSTAVVIPLNA